DHHRPPLSLHRQGAVRPDGARRRLRLPADAPAHLRADRSGEDERRDLPRDDEEDHRRRIPHRRSAGAPLPSRLRQVAVLQLSSNLQDRRRRPETVGGAGGPPPAPALRDQAARRPHRMSAGYRQFYRGRAVMITGGLGFIGSNLARALVDLGADVLVVDSLIPGYGGNLFNVAGIEDRLRINIADIRQQTTMNYLVRDRDVIFNLAGQVSHIDSMRDPYTDLEINCRSQLTILEACRYNNPRAKLVFAGTRQVYGRPQTLPVDESHLVRP